MKVRHVVGSGFVLLLLLVPAACQLLSEHGKSAARTEAIGTVRAAASGARDEIAEDPAVHTADPRAALRAARAHLSQGGTVTARESVAGFSLVARFDQNWYHSNQQYRVRLCVEYGVKDNEPGTLYMVDASCPPDPTFQPGLDEYVKLSD